MLDCEMYEKFGQFIDGKWSPSSNGETYEVINPATEEVLGKASKASPEDVDKALKSAEKGLQVWKKTAPWQRAYILRKIADKMREKTNVLAKWMTLEVGKPLAEAKGEIAGAADIFEWNAEETKRIYGQTVESRFEDTRVHVYYQPVGVVAALTPWNFPAVLSARKISTALAAGCSVIIKPDVITPGVVMEMEDMAYPLISGLVATDDPAVAFKGADYVVFLGAFPRREGMERKDVMAKNVGIFHAQGTALAAHAKKSVKCLVVGNPANTNAAILSAAAGGLPKTSITALTRLDHNRATSLAASKMGLPCDELEGVIIWGNHSSTQYPDVRHAKSSTSGARVMDLPADAHMTAPASTRFARSAPCCSTCAACPKRGSARV